MNDAIKREPVYDPQSLERHWWPDKMQATSMA